MVVLPQLGPSWEFHEIGFIQLNEPWVKTGIDDWAQLGKSCMGSGWAINWVPVGFCNLIINLTKYINIINFIYIIDKRKKNN